MTQEKETNRQAEQGKAETEIPCAVCRDLIPLVQDGVASPESETLVKAHENYNNGVQVTHSFYTDAEKAADRTKNNTGLFYFPAKAENAKFALILAGSGANESAELEEGACTAWQLHELGYAAFILRYRVWTDASDDAPLEDIGRAMIKSQ